MRRLSRATHRFFLGHPYGNPQRRMLPTLLRPPKHTKFDEYKKICQHIGEISRFDQFLKILGILIRHFEEFPWIKFFFETLEDGSL